MAGALSENAPRPVSVVTVEGGVQTNQPNNETSTSTTTTTDNNNHTTIPPPDITNQDLSTQCRLDNNSHEIQRCFASTEAQTENPIRTSDYDICPSNDELRDARRRERRVRRHHRRAMRSCSMPPSYPGGPGCIAAAVNGVGGAPGMPLVSPVGGFLHPPPPHLGLRGLNLGLPFPVPSAFGR